MSTSKNRFEDKAFDWIIKHLSKMDDRDLKWRELEAPVKGISCPKCNQWNWVDERLITSSTDCLMCIFGCGEIAKVSYHITKVLEV